MKLFVLRVVGVVLIVSTFVGCVNAEGRFRPIDPLGRALFDALDRGPRQNDAQYVDGPSGPQGYQQYGTQDVWVEGAYGRDASGRRVWVPGHWAQADVR